MWLRMQSQTTHYFCGLLCKQGGAEGDYITGRWKSGIRRCDPGPCSCCRGNGTQLSRAPHEKCDPDELYSGYWHAHLCAWADIQKSGAGPSARFIYAIVSPVVDPELQRPLSDPDSGLSCQLASKNTSQCRFDAWPASTLVQHQADSWQTSCVYWEAQYKLPPRVTPSCDWKGTRSRECVHSLTLHLGSYCVNADLVWKQQPYPAINSLFFGLSPSLFWKRSLIVAVDTINIHWGIFWTWYCVAEKQQHSFHNHDTFL